MSGQRNPFVGPNPLTRGDPLFGRDRELEDIQSLLIAERVLLLYSPSGAGKTSLIQAGLVSRLEDEGFHVLPLLRVYAGTEQQPQADKTNPYVDTVLTRLMQGEPAVPSADPATTGIGRKSADLPDNLPDFFNVAPSVALNSQPKLLIFDQFEEILTQDPTDIKRKTEFFKQLGATLSNEDRWALFAIKEEHLGSFDPYLHHIQNRLAARYRLNLLPRDQAADIIVNIAKSGEAIFDADSAQALTDNLASYRPPNTVESARRELPYVEPLHLQIVCRELWSKRIENDGKAIIFFDRSSNPKDDINRALASYFDEAVKRTAAGAEAQGAETEEKTIRKWFEDHLYTDRGIRRQIRRDENETAGLLNTVVDALMEERLLKVDVRGGISWIELAHDRLVEAIIEDNKKWFRRNLELFQLYALHWGREDESLKDKWLLTGDELTLAKQRIARLDDDPDDPVERGFLAACEEAEKTRLEQLEQDEERQQQKRSFLVQALNSQSAWERQLHHNHEIATLLAVQGLRLNEQLDEEERALNRSLTTTSLLVALHGQLSGHEFARQVRSASVAEDDFPLLLSDLGFAKRDGRDLIVQPFDRRQRLAARYPELDGEAVSLAPDCSRLVVLDSRGTYLHRVNRATLKLSDATLRGPFAFAEGALAGLVSEGIVRVWRDGADADGSAIELSVNGERVEALALNRDANLLAIGTKDGHVSINALSWTPQANSRVLCEMDLAAGEQGASDRTRKLRSRIVGLHLIDLNARRLMLIAQADGVLSVCQVAGEACSKIASEPIDLKRESPEFTRIERRLLTTSAVMTSGTRWAVGGTEGFVAIVDLKPDHIGAGEARRLMGHLGDIRELRFTPDGEHLAAADALGEIRVWDLEGLNNIAMRKVSPPPVSDRPVDQAAAIVATGDPESTEIYMARRGAGVFKDRLEPQDNGQLQGLHLELFNDVQDVRALQAFRFGEKSFVAIPNGSTLGLWAVGEEGDLVAQTDAGGEIRAMAVRAGQHRFASGTEGGLIRIWKLTRSDAGIRLADYQDLLHPSGAPARALALHPKRPWLVGAFRSDNPEENLLAWNLSAPDSGAVPLSGHERPVRALRFQRKPPYRLASGGEDSRIHLWDVDARATILPSATLIGHIGSVNALAFRGDEDPVLASAGNDGTVRLWDLGTSLADASRYPPPIVLGGASSELLSLAFLPDNDLLAAGDTQGNLYLWRTNRDSLIDAACEAMWRNLSRDEWQRFIGSADYEPTCPNLRPSE